MTYYTRKLLISSRLALFFTTAKLKPLYRLRHSMGDDEEC